jgi:uncharacterized protein YqeY
MGRKKTGLMNAAEKKFIDENPFNMSDHKIAQCLNRYVDQIRVYKRAKRGSMPRWSDEEINILKGMNGKYSDTAIAQRLGRTPQAVWGKKQRLGLLNGKPGRPRKKQEKKFGLTEFVRGVMNQHPSTWT